MKISKIVRKLNNMEKIDNSLGSELKRRRLMKNKTLAQVSERICSVSYTSKIENSLLSPQYNVLRQICEQLDITDNQMQDLINIEKLLHESVETFYFLDFKRLHEVFLKIENFNNFKADIIKIIYYTSNKRYSLVSMILDTLDLMIDSLNNDDLLIYAIFSSVFYNKTLEYHQSNEIILTIINHLKMEHKILKTIALNYLCDNYNHLNNNHFLNYYDKAINYNLDFNNLAQINRLKYLNFLYRLKNNDLKLIEKSLLALRNDTMYDTAKALHELHKENFDYFTEPVLNNLDYFTKCIYAHKYDSALFHTLIENMKNHNLHIKQQIHLEYLSIRNANQKFKYLEDTCYAHSLHVADEYLANLYGQELINHYCKQSTYKKALRISEELRTLLKNNVKE